jgi:hypothetical protein
MSAASLYASLKYLHRGSVVLSGAGFLLRGAGAVLTYAWIISVALTKNPYGYPAG